MIHLRSYQIDAVKAVEGAWQNGIQRPAVVLPCGLGKTIILAAIASNAHSKGLQTLILVHRDELVKQTIDKLYNYAPEMRIGVVKAERNEVEDVDVVVASVATLGKLTRLENGPKANIVIVDESHHASAAGYQRILRYYGCFTPGGANAVGFSATMERSDSKKLGDTWDKSVYTKDIIYGISNGYLVDVKGQAVRIDGLNLSKVSTVGGDYDDTELSDALENAKVPAAVAVAYNQYAAGRRGILFTPSVKSAYLFAEEFNNAGIPTAVVIGETPSEERALIYKRIKSGELLVISSVMVLTEGFDLPEIEVAVMCRPTQKAGLFTQMAGRVLRPAPWSGKTEALVLDVCGVSEEHRLATISCLIKSKAKVPNGQPLSQAAARKAVTDAEEWELASATREVNLFRSSGSSWLCTPNGIWFIPTTGCLIFINGEDDQYDVCRSHNNYSLNGPDAKVLSEKPLTQEWAMAWAESSAADLGFNFSTKKKASWRRGAPTAPQIRLLRRNKLPIPANKSEASDALSMFYATRMFSRLDS